MITTFYYVGNREYITTSTFVNYIFSTFEGCSSAEFYFHKITRNSINSFDISDLPLDRKQYNVTGNVTIGNDIKYFGFKEEEDQTKLRTVKEEKYTLEDVAFEDMVLVFGNHFRMQCDTYYDKKKERVLMANISFKNLDLARKISNYRFEMIKINLPKLYSTFYCGDTEICSACLIVKER